MNNAGTVRAQSASENTSLTKSSSNRSLWICTGYLAAGLALLGVLVYHFSTHFLR